MGGINILAYDIQKGMERNEFLLHYQPQVNLAQKRMIGVEALIRWMHPAIGMIPPVLFIPDAEKSRQIFDLEKWIFTKCLQQKTLWESYGLENIELAINLSNTTLNSDVAFSEIEEIISCYNVDFKSVTIEITETSMIKNVEIAIRNLESIKKYGIKIALDDFGTGYSSISHIKDLPVDIIKIDRSFIKDIHEKNKSAIIVKNIITMAHNLDLSVIAEGIEEKQQAEVLVDLGCVFGQGFLFAKPMPINEINKVLGLNVVTSSLYRK